jgi:hypothetical protein
MRYSIQMRRVYTTTNPAEMIQFFVLRDRSCQLLISPPMSQNSRAGFCPELSVAVSA